MLTPGDKSPLLGAQRIELHLWGSPFFGEIFANVTVFNPVIEVVTFPLRRPSAWSG